MVGGGGKEGYRSRWRMGKGIKGEKAKERITSSFTEVSPICQLLLFA